MLMSTFVQARARTVYSRIRAAAACTAAARGEDRGGRKEQTKLDAPPNIDSLTLARPLDAVPIALMSRRLVEAGLPTWAWTSRRVSRHVHDPDSVVLAARRGEEVTGFAIMGFGDEAAHLNLLAVEPRCRRAGLGTRLVRWLEESARTAGTFEVSLEVRASNAAARGFYKALGYAEVDLLPGYYDRIEDAIRMTRDLRVLRIDQPG